MRVAFYAPAKPPDHDVPSGDRTMARLLMAALVTGGHEVMLASRLRTYSADPSTAAREGMKRAALTDAHGLIEQWALGKAARPDCWFCYHPYYKSPDWIGPAVCQALGIPYLTAEASYAGKRDLGPWAAWQEAAVMSIRAAAINFCLTDRDMMGLAAVGGRKGRLVSVPPFIDCRTPAPGRRKERNEAVQLITVAMMRPGVKLESYRMLARALEQLQDVPWTLTIVGDGPERAAVAAEFRVIAAERVNWRGALPAEGVRAELAAADLFLWPGCGEAYGLAYLEAQAEGLPVVAQATAGVPSVVRHDATGLLTPEGNAHAYADAIRQLACDAGLRERMSRSASAFVRDERSLPNAARTLSAALATLSR